MSPKLIKNIKQLKSNLNRFKYWNTCTTFGYDSEDKFEGRQYIYSFYKGNYFRLIYQNGLLIPCTNQYIFSANNLYRKIKAHNKIIRQKINNDNYLNIESKVKDIIDCTINPDTNYESNKESELDLLFFICLTAEFFRQIKTNPELEKLIPNNNKDKNYMVFLIKNNL